jgi:hypothetical protein
MIHAVESEKKLEILHKPLRLDLSVNDLRIMVGCFKAIAYQMEIDDEPYLDVDALRLQKKLERKYDNVLREAENRRASRSS